MELLFKNFVGKPDPIVDFGRRWGNRLFLGSLIASLAIVLSFSEAQIEHNAFFSALYQAVSSAVPAVPRMNSVSHHPAYVGAVFALNWLFVPLYFVLTCMAYKFWNDEVFAPVMQRVAADKKRMTWLVAPVLSVYFLMDFGVIPGVGIYSMSVYAIAPQYGIFGALDSSPLGVAFLYWAMCVTEGLYYGVVVSVLCWFIRKRVAGLQKIERHP